MLEGYFNELTAFAKRQKSPYRSRKKRNDTGEQSEHTMQTNCVNWFRRTYPEYALLLFAVPNNAATNVIRGRMFKEEGLLKGVADLILLISNKNYHSLCIENKTLKGRQSPEQKAFQKAVESVGSKYIIIRSLDDFKSEITDYLEKSVEGTL